MSDKAMTDGDWPIRPALRLYDPTLDKYRPATQDDLDRLMQLASAGAAAFRILQSGHEQAYVPKARKGRVVTRDG